MRRRPSAFALLVASFVLAILVSILLVVISVLAHREIAIATRERHVAAEEVLQAEKLRAEFALLCTAHRGYLLSGEEEFVERTSHHHEAFLELTKPLEAEASGEQRRLIAEVLRQEGAHESAVVRTIALKSRGDSRAATQEFLEHALPARDATQLAIGDLVAERSLALRVAEG